MTTTALKQYNGNISSVNWQSKVPAGSAVTQVKQSYEYTYDRVNRLTLANYTTTGLTGQYNEVPAYDVMGNIVSLSRFQGNAATAIDQLVYTYDNGNLSNTLLSVADNSNNNLGQPGGTATYGYDPNGNLLKDNKKLLTFGYNYLNLPSSVTKTGTGAGTIAYIYDANGRKLRKVMTGANRDYVNGIEYNNTGTIEFIQTEEGRARPNGGSYFYEYALKDHLGNTRVLIGQDGVISQQTDYYAFGMEMSRGVNVTPSPDNKYKYNGKELQDELGMNLYDYGARFYDPVIARWLSVDPLVEAGQESGSPYGYVFDDPIKFTDPDGRAPDITIDGENNSSITIKTDLINVRVNASSLGIDFHGNHTINGERALQTGLDIVSFFDPTGIATAISGGISAKNGEYLDAAMSFAGVIPFLGKFAEEEKIAKDVKVIEEAVVGEEKAVTKVEEAYKRPNNATTKEQRASVQGEPCVKCGATDGKRVAGHKKALVKEHYETGTINKKRMRQVDAVQPECPTCSAKEGAEMSKYSKEQKKLNGL